MREPSTFQLQRSVTVSYSASYRIVRYLVSHPPQTNTELSKALKLPASLISSATYRLCKEGSLVRKIARRPRSPWLYDIPSARDRAGRTA